MSLEGVTDATARALATASGMKAVYASTAGNQGDTVKPIPQDVADTPVAFVRHGGFTVEPGSFERIRHTIVADIYINASSAGAAEKIALPLVTNCIAAMRTHVGLYGQAGVVEGAVRRGGPPFPEDVAGKSYIVWPLFIEVLEATIQTYTL